MYSIDMEFLILCPLVFLAGFIDAIAGGGGLISMPAFLLIGLPGHEAIATNKMSSSLGTTIATVKYAQAGYINWRRALFCVVCALAGSWCGSSLVLLIPADIFSVVMLILLPVIAFYVLKSKRFESNLTPFEEMHTILLCCVIAFFVGMYDGFYGPGTGTFLMILLTVVAHVSLQDAAGTTKIINLTSNLTALVVFLLHGKVLVQLGLIAGVFNIAGNYLGARLFTRRGAAIARPITIGILTILFVKVILEYFL